MDNKIKASTIKEQPQKISRTKGEYKVIAINVNGEQINYIFSSFAEFSSALTFLEKNKAVVKEKHLEGG